MGPDSSKPRPLARLRSLARPPVRQTNQALLVALLLAFVTGVVTIATGSSRLAWIAVSHGIFGLMVVWLIPWKSRVARRGFRRARPTRWLSLLLAVLALAVLFFGLAYATGLVRSVAGQYGLWLHIALALAIVPLVAWHVVARGLRPHRGDLSRRVLLRGGLVAAAAGALYAAGAATIGAGLPGARRRFTGSYEFGSYDPQAMPVTIWLLDTVPSVDPARYRLTVADRRGVREMSLPELTGGELTGSAAGGVRTVQATLDCTSGWYSRQNWAGVPVAALLAPGPGTRSVYVHSMTGYWVRVPVSDLGSLLLATHAGGEPLLPEHGYPARLVAPGRRGYWWVKWVDRIEAQDTPPWWQPPFPTG